MSKGGPKPRSELPGRVLMQTACGEAAIMGCDRRGGAAVSDTAPAYDRRRYLNQQSDANSYSKLYFLLEL